jgi:hypothetical protein
VSNTSAVQMPTLSRVVSQINNTKFLRSGFHPGCAEVKSGSQMLTMQACDVARCNNPDISNKIIFVVRWSHEMIRPCTGAKLKDPPTRRLKGGMVAILRGNIGASQRAGLDNIAFDIHVDGINRGSYKATSITWRNQHNTGNN